MSVEIEQVEGDLFLVKVVSATSTEHRVTLSDAYRSKIFNERLTKEEILRRSFAFLLERESNSSILRSFDLPAIQRYFPEYESTAARWE
jgi:hypothetical protein